MNILKTLNYILDKNQKYLFLINAVLLCLTSAIDLFSLILLFDVFQYFAGLSSLKTIDFVYNFFGLEIQNNFVFNFLIIFFFIKFIFILFANYQRLKFQKFLAIDFSNKFFHRYLNDNILNVKKKTNSQLVRNIEQSIGLFTQGTIQHIFSLISEISIIVFIFISLFYFSGKIMLISILNIFVLTSIYYLIFRKKILNLGKEFHNTSADKLSMVANALNGMLEIRAFKAQKYFLDKYNSFSKKSFNSTFKLLFVQQIPRHAIEFIIICLVFASIIFLYDNMDNKSEILKMLGLFGIASIRLIPSATKIMHAMQGLKHTEAIVSEIKEEVIEQNNFIIKKESIGFYNSKLQSKNLFFDSLVFDNVSYKYNDKSNFVFKNINIEIKKNSKTLIVGASGAGKTTFLNLLLNFLTPTSGNIYLKNGDIKKKLSDIVHPRFFGYVPQKTFLIQDTIKKNIAFGINDDDINDQKINEAINLSGLSLFIKSVPDGIDSNIEDFASNISGGQAQRMSIARCFYNETEFMIFDEPFSSLDLENEKLIINNINNYSKNKTVIIISHKKIDSIQFDNIFEIKNYFLS